jgi:hypothetical protein
MKSIREWMEERGVGESFNRTSFQNTMGTGEVNPAIKVKLRSRVLDLAKEFPEMNQTQLFQSIMTVVGQLLTHGSGTKVAVGNLYKKLNNGAPQAQPNNTEDLK